MSFIALYGLAMLQPALPFIDYILRYDYISKVLCINKDIPEMRCNGKCHLSQQLRKAAEDEKNRPFTPPKIELKDYPVSEVTLLAEDVLNTSIRELVDIYINHYQFLRPQDIFRPPQS